jgi:hypothetical protein
MELAAQVLDWLDGHRIQVGTWIFALSVMGIRSLVWLYKPAVTCDTCAHTAKANRVIRGSIGVELVVLAHGLTVGLVIMEVLWVTIVYFLWRTLGSYLTCANCGSERISKPGVAFEPASNAEAPSVAVIQDRQEKWWY